MSTNDWFEDEARVLHHKISIADCMNIDDIAVYLRSIYALGKERQEKDDDALRLRLARMRDALKAIEEFGDLNEYCTRSSMIATKALEEDSKEVMGR